MKRSRSGTSHPGARARKAGPDVIPDKLPKSLQPFAAPEGASVFDVALTEATPEHVRKVEEVTGPINRELFVTMYSKTQNPIWLWLSLAGLKNPGEVPLETFAYLVQAADKLFAGFVEQVCSLENVQITPGKEIEEGVARRPDTAPSPPDVPEILALSRPGRNLVQAAARDFRHLSYAVGVANHAREKGVSLDQAYNDMAKAVGRTSAETGAAAASVRMFAHKGKKLIGTRGETGPGPRGKVRRG